MIWIAPSGKDPAALEKRFWDAVDQFRPKKFEGRRSKGEFQSVRRSAFVLRHLHRLAVHSLELDIRHGGNVNSCYHGPHDTTGRFDFVLAA